jgi:hypothetical protein
MPGGRPSNIDTVLRNVERRDPETGEITLVPVTVFSHIVDALRVGMYLEPAILSTGISKSTVYAWLKTAGTITLAHSGREVNRNKLSAHERRCLDFLEAVDEAQHSWELRALADHSRIERGGWQSVTVREKVNAAGEVVERTTTSETMAPDARAIEWRLTRRFPERYSQRVVLSGDFDELSDTDRALGLADAVGAYLAGREDEASETTRSTPARARRARRAAPTGEA